MEREKTEETAEELSERILRWVQNALVAVATAVMVLFIGAALYLTW